MAAAARPAGLCTSITIEATRIHTPAGIGPRTTGRRAVVTLGPDLDIGRLVSTDNVRVVSSAPHNIILRDASLLVTHCGHGTTMKALAKGISIVCIPMGRDQNDTAARVVHHGAGVRLSPGASVTKIRHAVQNVLANDRYRMRASQLAVAIDEERRSCDIVAELEEAADLQVDLAPDEGRASD